MGLKFWKVSLDRGSSESRLMSGIAAYGLGDLMVRLIRLCATLVLARRLDSNMIGQAAFALTLFELVRVLARNGIGQAIIASRPEELEATCNRAHKLFWRVSWLLVATQLAVAALLALPFAQFQAGVMLAVLSLVYLMMPGGLVQVHLAMREGLTGRNVRTASIQNGADHVLTAALLLCWASPWALVLPKLLTTPIWLIMARRARPWRPDRNVPQQPIAGLRAMSLGVMGAELFSAVRSNADNLIIAAVLGTGALGTYYFAFSAGLGLTTSLITAMGSTLFPLLCEERKRETVRTMLGLAAVAGTIPIIVQAAAAPYYVPLVFGARWANAAELVATLCLAGLAQMIQVILGSWLRARGKAPLEAAASLLACGGSLGGLALGAAAGSLQTAAIGLTSGQLLAALLSLALILPRATGARLSQRSFA